MSLGRRPGAACTALLAATVSAAVLPVLCTRAASATWSEPFGGEELSREWEVDLSGASKGGLGLGDGRLTLTVEEDPYLHIEAEFAGPEGPGAMDGTDLGPLRVDCQIYASHLRGLPTMLALYWNQRNFFAVGPVQGGWREKKAQALWLVTQEDGEQGRGHHIPGFSLGYEWSPAYFRIVVTTRSVTAFASVNGVHYLPVASLERKPDGAIAGPPKRLIVGRGWFGDDPARAKPDLDNDGRGRRKELHAYTFDGLCVTNEQPRTPLGPPPGYEARDTWDQTLESYHILEPFGNWMLLGPLARKKKGDYGPEKAVDLEQAFELAGGKQGTWVPHVPEEGSTSGHVNLRHTLGAKDSREVYFAYARIVADEPRKELFSFNGYRWVSLRVGGLWLSGGDTHRSWSVPGFFKSAAELSKGVNHVLVQVEGDHKNAWFTMRHAPADPGRRIALLRRLIADFPEETDRAVAARFEIARLWEEKACARKAIDVLGEVLGETGAGVGHVPMATVEDAYAARARLFKLLKDGDSAARDTKALVQALPEGSPERAEASLRWLAAELRVGRERSVENRVEELERPGSEDPERLRLLHETLAGVYEELGKREGRLEHLRRALAYVDDGSAGADALLVEYAEALLEPARKDYAEKASDQITLDQRTVRQALDSYRRAVDIACKRSRRSATPPASRPARRGAPRAASAPDGSLSRELSERAEAVLRTGDVERALKILPAVYVRACIGCSEAGIRLLEKLPKRRSSPGRAGDVHDDVRDLAAAKMVKGWHVVGPFDNTGWKAYSETIVDPRRVDLSRPVRGKPWRVPPDKFYASGHLDLMGLLQQENCVAFLYREMRADEVYETKLRIGCDDGLTLWFNGKKLFEDRVQRGVAPDTVVLPVKFRKGVNRILVRVQQGGGAMGFLLSLGNAPTGAPGLSQLLFELERSPGKHSGLAGGFLDHARALAKENYEGGKAVAGAVVKAFPDRPDVQLDAAVHFVYLGLDKQKDLPGAEEFATRGEALARQRPVPGRERRLHDLLARGAQVSSELGDLDGAVRRLRGIVRSGAEGDVAVRALLGLGDTYRAAGYLETAKGHYLDALGRPIGDAGLLIEAHSRLGNMRHIPPNRPMFDTSFDAAGMLRTADRAAARGDTERALRGYQRAVDSFAGCLFRLNSAKLVGVAEYAADRIHALGAEGVAAYRERFDSRAKSLFGRAAADLSRKRDPLLMSRVAEEYRCSSFGDDALNRLGNLFLDSGRPARAAHAFGRILAEHRDTDLDRALVRAKYAAASAEAGRPDRALRALDVLARESGRATFVVGGRNWRAASYAEEQRLRLRREVGRAGTGSLWPTMGGSARRAGRSPASPDPRRTRYEVRFPVSPVGRFAAPRIAEGHYRPVLTHGAVGTTAVSARPGAVGTTAVSARPGAVAGKTVFFHTLDECFAVDLGNGALRWRSGLFFEGLRRGAASPKFSGAPETMTSVDGERVYVRALRRSGRGIHSTFVIEARDSRDGRLLWSTGARSDLAGLAAVSSPAVADGAVFAVLQEGGDSQQLHAAAFDAATGDLLWRSSLVGGFAGLSFTDQRNVYLGDHAAAPSVADEDVYVATDMGAIAALSAATGSIRWIAQYPRATLDPQRSGRVKAMLLSRAATRVVVGDRCLYVAPRDALALLCVRRANGDILWRRELVDCQSPVGFVGSGPKRRPDGAAGNDSGRLVIQGRGVASLDAATGAVRWRWLPSREDGTIHGLAALGGALVYVPTEAGIRQLHVEDGRETGFRSWKELGAGAPAGNLVVLDDAIVGFGLGRLVTFDADAGGRAEVVTIPGLSAAAERNAPLRTPGLGRAELEPPVLAMWHLGGGAGRVLTPAGADPGEIYLFVGESVARVLLNENRVSWRGPAASDAQGIWVSGDVVLLVYERFLSALDRNTGEQLWSTFSGKRKWLALAEDALVLLGEGEHLTVLDPKDGTRISELKVGHAARAARTFGRELFVLFADRANLWAKAFDAATGEELWQHDFEVGASNRTKLAGVLGDCVYIYSKKRLLCFDVMRRKTVFDEPLDPSGDPWFRFEGGYLVAVSYQSWNDRTAFVIDPETGKLLYQRKHKRDQPVRFWPGRAILSRLDREGRTACVSVPGGEELWSIKGGGWHEHYFAGVFAERYWAQPYRREGRIRCRLIGSETGGVEDDFTVPGSTGDRDPGFTYREGLLIYGTDQGVYALGGLPAAPRGRDPLAEAVQQVRRSAALRTPREREGSSEFLAAYAREAYGVFLASRPIRVDGRADDWRDVKAVDIREPIQLRAESSGEGPGPGWSGPEDLSGRVRLAWDRSSVFVSAEITDDMFVPPAPGAGLSTGDSVIIGFDAEADSAEAPDSNDLLFQLALVGGRSELVQLHGRDAGSLGEGADRPVVRVSRTVVDGKEGLFYELALPWGALRAKADERPGGRPKMRFGLAALDWDGSAPDGAIEWGYGLLRGFRPRLFVDVSFVDFSPERMAQYRRFIDVLPSHPLSWRFLNRISAASVGKKGEEGPATVFEEFVLKRPGSSLVPWALAELVRLHRQAGRASPEEEVAALARRAKVPARAIGDALGPGEHSDGLGGAFRQWVYLDPDNTPVQIMISFATNEAGWERRGFWGADIIRWGKPNTESRWPMGELPPSGRWVQLTIPVGALKLEGLTVQQIDFAAVAGKAYWDRTEYVADGDVKVLLDDELAKGAAFRGDGEGQWVESPVKTGLRAHTNKSVGGRSSTRHYQTAVPLKVDPPIGRAKELTKAELEKYVEAAGILPDTEEAVSLLGRAEGLYSDLKKPERAEGIAAMYAGFLRSSPETPLAHRILTHIRRTLERASVGDAVARCERIMDDAGLGRAQRRLFYSAYAAGIPQWAILGYFDAGGEARSIEKALAPERFPVNLTTTYRRADGSRLAWQEIASEDGAIEFRTRLGSAPAGTSWPVGYLYTRLEAPRHQRVSLTVRVRGKCAAWVGGRRAGPTVSGGGRHGEEFSIPVSLKKGVNEILLKVSEKDAAARVVCRVADLNGRPIEDLAPRLPLRLIGALAYESADETRLLFSRPVSPVSAIRTANYSIDRNVKVTSARVEADGRTVVLTTSKLSPETTYTVRVTGVTDSMTPPNGVEPGARMTFSRTVRGMGVGLKGEYFEGQDLKKLKVTRIDATVDFEWGAASPDPAVPADQFSVRWTGRVEPLSAGRYSFHTYTDDGARLWIDGKLVIDDWILHSPAEATGHIDLEAGMLYSIKLEFFEGPGGAVAKLLWTDPVRGKEVVPTSQLYP